MHKNIKSVFATECEHVVVNSRFIRNIVLLEQKYVNGNPDHSAFLGGVLLAIPRMRFHTSDRNAFFDEILEVDDVVLKNELYTLDSIDPSHKVASDVFSLSVAWTLHAIKTSTRIGASEKEAGMMAILKYLHYRFITSTMNHFLKYDPNRATAEATYAQLSFKFALKRAGSWAKMIEKRVQDIIAADSIHAKTIERFDDDHSIKFLITDTQGRMREVIKKMMRVFMKIHASGARVSTRNNFVEMEGELHLRDIQRQSSQYKQYAHSIMSDQNTFIRPELIRVIADAMHTMPERHLITSLKYSVDNYGKRGDKRVLPLIDEVVLHALEFMKNNPKEFRSGINLKMLLFKLRSLYMSSRSTDPSLIKMRDLSSGIVKSAIKSNNNSLIASVRTGVMLYIVVRTFAMSYYVKGGSLESDQFFDHVA